MSMMKDSIAFLKYFYEMIVDYRDFQKRNGIKLNVFERHMKYLRKFYSYVIQNLFGYKKLKNSFFTKPKRKDYEKLVGRCFKQIGGGEVIKILAIPEDNEKYEVGYYEFIFERYDQYLNGKWYEQDYNWLQEDVYGKYGVNSKFVNEYTLNRKQYADISSQADMNISSEDMYHLGIDGNIYINIGCSNTWLRYKEISNNKFERIKRKALKNGKFKL